MKDKMAVISLGGKQHLVTLGSQLAVNRLTTEKEKSIETEALLVTEDGKTTVGAPKVGKAKVTLKVIDHIKDKKVTVSRFRAKSRYRRKLGHRQPITTLEVIAISA